jgi:putative PEP-CTERM system histidine kinase
MTLPHVVFPLAAGAPLILAAAIVLRRPRTPPDVGLTLALTALGVDAVASYVLVGWTTTSDARAVWLRIFETLGLFVPLASGAFLVMLLTPVGQRPAWRNRIALLVGSGAILVISAATWLREPLLVSGGSGPFPAIRMGELGAYSVIAQLLGTVGVLVALEVCLRTASRDTRWRLKFLVLGLGGIFVVRLYVLCHLVLFGVLPAAYLTTQAAALFLGLAAIGASVMRTPLGTASFVLSRAIVLRSAVIGLFGAYLFVIGSLGWLVDRLGLSEEMFWGSLLVFAAVGVAGAVVLSEHVRWRLKRFIGLHLYRSKYDYRAQWMTFTRRLGSTVAAEELGPQLLAATADAVGTAKGILYLGDGATYHAGAAIEVFHAPSVIEGSHPLAELARASTSPVPLRDDERPPWFPQATILLPLTWQGTLAGLMVLAGERTGAPYSGEDIEFLSTVAIQVTAAIVTTRLSESVARAREFEAFHRLTSFVIHDVKNAISGLSMLSHNALKHFDDPEFQRDAITTLSRTVDRMRGLLRRLASTSEVAAVEFDRLDLAALLAQRIAPLARVPHVTLTLHLRPATILGDPHAIERVFQNLVLNAIDAIDGGGEIVLTSETRDDVVVCEVSDSGWGMSPEFQRLSLFVPFRTSKKDGWGIGLYHAREIVHAHRGRIDVQSEEGRGTTFTISFPAAREHAS